MNCDAKNEIPASAMVSDICSSMGAPWVEISSAIHHVCRRMGIADSNCDHEDGDCKEFRHGASLDRVL